jgi:L-galactono-1,4-lactone dehydrogenase
MWSSKDSPVIPDRDVAMSNWSGTHTMTTRRLFTPETRRDLEELVAWAAGARQKLRPVGTGLSPNGLSQERRGMLSMSQLDGIVNVDTANSTITVEAGARVSQILAELQRHGLTLENFSSITEQQIGGWTQVSAHGTGARIPTVDEMITHMTLITPGRGVLQLSKDGPDAELFRWAKVGLGTLGIVSELTLKCIPRYTLHERTYCTTVDELRRNHAELLRTYRHVRYMWIPYTDTIVVVVSDLAKPGARPKPAPPQEELVKPLKDLLLRLNPDCGSLEGDNFAQLREKLLVLDPLNPDHVAKVNRAEAEFWKMSTGERIADSTEILGFECGGVQWVLENCFPCGTISNPSLADIDYVVEMKGIIEAERIAAASPIEQRWTSRSTSPMSPAYSQAEGDIFSWVGVIMYITDEDRAPAIRKKFREYAMRHADLTFKYGGVFHWGKVDLNFHEGSRSAELSKNFRQRFDLAGFQKVRAALDPRSIFGNNLTDIVLRA